MVEHEEPLSRGAYSYVLKGHKKFKKDVFVGAFCESFDQSKLSGFFQRPLKLGAEKVFFFGRAPKHAFRKGENVVDGKKPGAKSRRPT